MSPLTLLAVLAHPDDESFGMGGTLALYARRGVAVHLICATRGEAGTMAPEHLEGYASPAERREAELRCAAEKLGLTAVHFLGYRDSGMPGAPDNAHPQALINAPVEEVAERVLAVMERIRPQVVLTFDPIGGYKHPDHIAMHRATVLAFERARATWPPEVAPQKLYFHIFPRKGMRLAVRLMPLFGLDPRRWGKNGDIDLVSLVEEGDFPIHALVDYGEVAEAKAAASACHASQLGGGPGLRGPLAWLMRLGRRPNTDYFMRAFPAPRPGEPPERDLFAGVNGMP